MNGPPRVARLECTCSRCLGEFLVGVINLAVRDSVIAAVEQVLTDRLRSIMNSLDDVLSLARQNTTVLQSLLTLFEGIRSQLQDILNGQVSPAVQAKVDALFSELSSQGAQISAAVLEGTPQAPPGPPTTNP